jgi:hypothetical protein
MTPRDPSDVTRLLLIVCLVVIATSPIRADPASRQSRVRALDDAVGELLRLGYRHSPTFRRLVQALERSDVIAHLEMGAMDRFDTAGVTRFAGQRGGQRYVRIVVTESPRPRSTSVAVLGHELYHALEVARAKWVVDAASYQHLYQQIGFPSCAAAARCYDTREAAEIGSQILGEFWGK